MEEEFDLDEELERLMEGEEPEPGSGPEKESMEAVVKRLAGLSPLEYDQIRKEEAKALGVRPGTLDAAVKEARKDSKEPFLPFDDVDPWPKPVDPSKLLTDISRTIRRFIVCSEEVAHAAALWVAMTHLINEVQVAPFALITAPEKRCGKTLLLSILGKLAARAVTASNISPAALYRTMEAWGPTLLIDEADSFLKDNEELRGVLNSGHTRDSAYVIRTVGDDFTPTKFSTWGAKAISGIGHVADTLMDRSIVLELRRKLPHEEVERMRHADPGLFDDLQAKLARFAQDYAYQVRRARPPLPDSLNDRAADNWEPLLQVAMTAGGEWLRIGTAAALKLSGGEEPVKTIGNELLADIKAVFEERAIDRISSENLISALCSDPERPWATYFNGKPMTAKQLAGKLRGYGIKSKGIRIGDKTPKGYELEQFKDAFSRYVQQEKHNAPPHPDFTRNNATFPKSFSYSDNSSETKDSTFRKEKQHNNAKTFNCFGVADKNGVSGDEDIFSDNVAGTNSIFVTPDDVTVEVMPR